MESKYSKYVTEDLSGSPVYNNIVVFTLTMNRVEYTKRMLASVNDCLHEGYTHIIIDQGSVDGTVDLLKDIYVLDGGNESSRFRIVLLNKNIGISAASNLALDIVDKDYPNAKYIWKIDNDCLLLSKGMDSSMVQVEESFHDSIVLSPYVKGLRENKGGAPRYMSIDSQNPKMTLGLSYHLGGICEFASKESYAGFRFDEGDTLSGSQDSSYSAWVTSKGYAMAYCENLYCEHMDTTDGQHRKYPDYFKKRAEVESKVTFLEMDVE